MLREFFKHSLALSFGQQFRRLLPDLVLLLPDLVIPRRRYHLSYLKLVPVSLVHRLNMVPNHPEPMW